jgi:uncharacterized protein (TIGR02646 family)
MIKLDRGPAPADILVYAKKTVKNLKGIRVTRAQRELEEAIAFFTNKKNYAKNVKITKEKFTFEVYKDPALAAALEKAMGRKCAYCESDFAHVMPKDIEHFRPKAEITSGDTTLQPGYYWLAAEWENLLVSCADCNRARNHEVPEQPEKVKLGKETQFPLSDEQRRVRQRRVRTRGAFDAEEAVRLLVNPCVDEPGDHLTFDEKGLIHARPDANGNESAMGTTSIAVYALQRKELVEKRLQTLNSFRHQFDQLNYLVENHNDLKTLGASAAKLDANLAQIRAVREEMKTMLDAKAPYLAMLREWIRKAKQHGHCALLEQFGIDLTKPIDQWP